MKLLQQPGETIAYLWAVPGTCLGSLLLSPLRHYVDLSNVALLYVLWVVLMAVTYGRGPAVATALMASLAYAYFFVPPHFSLAITEGQYLLAAVIMPVVAMMVSHLTSRLKQHADFANRKSGESTKLYQLTQELAGATTPETVIDLASQFLAASYRANQIKVYLPAEFDSTSGPTNPALLNRCAERQELLSRPTSQGKFYALVPLVAGSGNQGILGFEVESAILGSQDAVEHIETVASVVAVALERSYFAEKARQTEIKHAAEALRSSILAALSHDLRTPLTALVGMAETIAMGKVPVEKQRQTLDAIRNQAVSISRQMTNLLDMAKLSAGKFELVRAWQPVEEVIGATLQQVRAQWHERKVTVDLARNLPPINIDAVLIERVLWNLIENAIKYSPADTPVQMLVKAVGEDMEISVCDSGSGIPAENGDKLFDLFQRGKSESGIPGVGLGLSIAKTIVEAHEGTITARNRESGGSCFSIRIPLGNPPHFEEMEEQS